MHHTTCALEPGPYRHAAALSPGRWRSAGDASTTHTATAARTQLLATPLGDSPRPKPVGEASDEGAARHHAVGLDQRLGAL